jgi:hypothetical protein
MSEHAAALGLPKEFAFGEKKFNVGPATQELKGQYGQWLAQTAVDNLRRREKSYAPHEYAARMERLEDKEDTFRFSWGAPLFWPTVDTVPGRTQLLYLGVKKNHSDFTETQAAKLVEEFPAVCLKVVKFLVGVPEDPNDQPATTETTSQDEKSASPSSAAA